MRWELFRFDIRLNALRVIVTAKKSLATIFLLFELELFLQLILRLQELNLLPVVLSHVGVPFLKLLDYFRCQLILMLGIL